MRVLIVEDKEENSYYLRALLQGNGYQVELAQHGAQALVMARQAPPDMVISDLLMPVMDGYTLLRYWRADERLRQIPFVVYTATYTEAEDERLAYDLGADEFILKPCEPDVFMEKLRAVQLRDTVARPVQAVGPDAGETATLEHYSQTLIRKLEEKTLQLEETNRALQKELTERREIEKEVRLKNTILQTEQETALDAILVVGENGEILTRNRKFHDLWKIPESIMEDRREGQVLELAADQVADTAAFLAQVRYLYGHRWAISTDEFKLNDGRVIERYSAPVAGDDGTYYGRIWYFRDVSEARRIQQSLRNNEQEQRQLVKMLELERSRLTSAQEVAKIGSWETDLSTLSVIWSAQTYRIFDVDPEHFQPSHAEFLERVHPEDRAGVEQAFFASLGVRTLCAVEHRILFPDGRIKYVEERWQLVFDDAGKPVKALGTCQDISERRRSEAALKASEIRYHSLIETMLEGYAYCRAVLNAGRLVDFVYVEVNRAFQALTGLNEVVGKKVSEVIPDLIETNPEVFEAYGRVVRTRMPEKFESYVPQLAIWFDATIYSTNGEHFTVVFENITQRKESEARIRYLNRVYAMLSDINALIVHAREQHELFRETCRIASEIGGFRMAMIAVWDKAAGRLRPAASIGKADALVAKIENILCMPQRARTSMFMRAITERHAIVANHAASDPNVIFGSDYAQAGIGSVAVLPLIVENVAVGLIALYAGEVEFFHQEEMRLLADLAGDISFAIDHIEKQERLTYLAYYDELTGLANRNLFFDRVEHFIPAARSRQGRLAVLLIDLDRFKNVNDSLGRSAGDILLRQIAQWLVERARDQSLLARVAGDRFAVVIPQVMEEGHLPKLLGMMTDALLARKFKLGNISLRVSCKAGVAIFPDDGDDAETLFRNAEAALKRAKESGARYLFHTKAMTELVAHKLEMENRLRHAIDHEEFVLHYQPKVDMQSGKVVGAEALIRWSDPRSGLVAPGQFIPMLEQTGLIYEVGSWALGQAIADYLRWRAQGYDAVRIAVNVSPLQLRDQAFVDGVRQKLSVDPGAAHGLELELTESMIMQDLNQSIASLETIRGLGVKVAIDDFGTGFSSLGYLAKLPVDTLKIDRSFITDMTDSSQGLVLVSTIINLARGLNLRVVAEGVETDEQYRLLKLLKCDEMQGFLFSKPLPVDAFEVKYLRK
ncbi:EAL domain-containing protein [Bordetella sp. FB-8]|uniref:EAL domain-containing protein n=1 Tax=Bordetella sp. FB-8 TaxID=1159870 RepID=UPI000372C868|nr:EAL domain-containing protein [Bordetella sp. FB-8]